METTPEKNDKKQEEQKEGRVSDIEEIKRRLAEDFESEKIETAEQEIKRERAEESFPETAKQESAIAERTAAEEEAIRAKIDEEAALIETNPELQKEAEKRSQELKKMEAEGKLKGLFGLAEAKGIPFAVAAARAMDDPYILDTFHDRMAKEGYYKTFVK